jgi:hypothetical protein
VGVVVRHVADALPDADDGDDAVSRRKVRIDRNFVTAIGAFAPSNST